MVKTSVPTRVLSVALAAALSFTLLPCEGMAFAVESISSADQSAEGVEGAQAQDGQDADASADVPAEGAGAVDRVSEDVELGLPAASAASQGGAASENALEAATDIEITRTSVSLDAAATTVLSYNGLMFQVSADGTASCIGWTGTAPEGELQIPAQAVAAGKVYPVVRIMSGGGFIARRG